MYGSSEIRIHIMRKTSAGSDQKYIGTLVRLFCQLHLSEKLEHGLKEGNNAFYVCFGSIYEGNHHVPRDTQRDNDAFKLKCDYDFVYYLNIFMGFKVFRLCYQY